MVVAVGVVVVVVVVVVAVAVAVVGQQRCDMVCRGARRPVMHTWYKDGKTRRRRCLSGGLGGADLVEAVEQQHHRLGQ